MRIARLVVPAAAAFVVLLFATGVLATPTLPGLPTTPFATLLLVPLLQLAMFLSGAVAVGGALVGGVFRADDRARAIGVRAALVFAVTSALLAVANLADVLAVQWWQALRPSMLMSFLTQIDEGRYLMLQVVFAVSAVLILARVQPGIDAGMALGLLLIATALPGFTGHSSAAVTHWLASTAMITHLVGMNLWVGGVIVLLAVPDDAAVRRFQPIGLAAYGVLLLGGIASTFARVTDWNLFFHDAYALVLAGKIALAIALGGVAHAAGRSAQSVHRRLALQATLMLVALAFAVVLGRMANP